MIAGLDSSFDAPTLAQAREAYASGVRIWGGYLGSRDGLGLAVRWNRMSFWNVQQAGIVAVGFCSGYDDPDWIRTTATEWGILACVDVENGIRDDGAWVSGFVQRARCGLYGSMSTHYQTGEPDGRGAAFNILAWYPGYDPRSTWFDAIELRPSGPAGWQWQGTHTELGLGVDRGWYDDWFLAGAADPASRPLITSGGEGTMVIIPDPGEPGLHRFYIASPHGNVRWAWASGGEGALDSGTGDDIDLGGAGLLPGTLAVALHTYRGRYRFAVQALSGDGNVYQKVMDGPDRSVIEDWRAVPTAEPVLAPGGNPGPAGPDVRPEVADALEAAVSALRAG